MIHITQAQHDAFKAAVAERDRLLALTAWLPIETAPKKTPILMTDGSIVTAATIDQCGGYNTMLAHGFGGYEWDYDFRHEEATHWMPLPAPPTSEGGLEGEAP